MSSAANLNEIREATGVAPWDLLLCPTCGHPAAHPGSVGSHSTYVWAKQLACSACHFTWWVCIHCTSSKKHITSSRMLQRHHGAKHNICTINENDTNNKPMHDIERSIMGTKDLGGGNDFSSNQFDNMEWSDLDHSLPSDTVEGITDISAIQYQNIIGMYIVVNAFVLYLIHEKIWNIILMYSSSLFYNLQPLKHYLVIQHIIF